MNENEEAKIKSPHDFSHRRGLNTRQKLYLKIRGEHPEWSDAKCKREAGYSYNYSNSGGTSNALARSNMKRKIIEELEKKGISDDYIAQKILEGLNSFQKSYFQQGVIKVDDKGKIISGVYEKADIDFRTRQKYLELLAKIKGDLIEKVLQENTFPEGIPSTITKESKKRISAEIEMLFSKEMESLKKKRKK